MRKYLILCILLLVATTVNAGHYDLNYVTTSDYLRIPLLSINDSGTVAVPDSGHIFVWFEGEATANSASYSTRWTDAGASGALVDSVELAGVDYWYFVDQIADIDNGEGEGNYTGLIAMFTDGQPTLNSFSFTLYDTESELVNDSVGFAALDASKALDSLSDVLDSLESISTVVDVLRDSIQYLVTATDVNVTSVDANAIGDGDIAANAIGANELNIDAVDEIWEYPVANITTADGIGDSLMSIGDTIIVNDRDVNVASVNADAIGVGDIADNVITSAKIANDAIGATEIADDAIDYGTFAATAPTAWWNEGKTGYTVSTVSDKSGYTLTASEWEKVWYDIDTTNVDTSLIGEWLSTGISASLSDANMGAIADSVWLKDTSDVSTAAKIGILMDAKISDAGGVASISDADMASIIDTLMLRALADTSDGSVTDKVLTYLVRNVGGGSGLDSATISNILYRVVWGIAKGVGDDSTTASQRVIQKLVELDEDNTTIDLNGTTFGTVTTATNLTTNNDKTGYSLSQSFPTNFADLAITATTGKVTVGTNDDKTGYTASTVSDKTGYSLASPQTFNLTGNITGNLSGSVGSVTGGATSANQVLIIDTINGIIDTLQLYDTRFDSLLLAIEDANKGNFKADVSALATSANLTLVIDTVNGIIDSLQNQDNWIGKEATIGALNDIAAVDVWNTAFNTAFTGGSMGDSLNNSSLATIVTKITAALDTMLLYNGYRDASRSINVTSADEDSLLVYNSTTLIMRMLFHHIGGTAGDPPDSVNVEIP
jgi:hypothetical protein